MMTFLTLILSGIVHGQTLELPKADLNELAKKDFVKRAKLLQVDSLLDLPVQSNGRIKPLRTLAREVSQFITGSRKPFGLDPLHFYFGLTVLESAASAEIIEIRSKEFRDQLGLPSSVRFVSVTQLQNSGLEQRVKPLLMKEQANRRSLSTLESGIIEVFHQLNLTRGLMGGGHFVSVIDFSGLTSKQESESSIVPTAEELLIGIKESNPSLEAIIEKIKSEVRSQSVPTLFSGYENRIQVELIYDSWRPFFIAGILFFIIGLLLLFGVLNSRPMTLIFGMSAIPMLLQILGLSARVFVTGFSPVTNMFGTMIWVSFGVALFTLLLFYLYKNHQVTGLLLTGSGLVLLLAESFPLILSPDMDPIVAVLRSNYWLTIHVLTVTISYAAFTTCALIGNLGLVKFILGTRDEKYFSTLAHYIYRMAQLGVCLLTAGIILGGIWADYSWGRFWGWDPKETWALIADMGFIIILHAKFVGWLRAFGIIAAAPIAYLLVIMAWYGVNFILAAGLHSYGFSSGGATFVGIFIAAQISISIISGLIYHYRISSRR